MRAAVLHEHRRPFAIEELDLAPPGPAEAEVRLLASGVCRSDWNTVTGDTPSPLPAVLGHEGAGVVERVGTGVTAVAPGDHVVLSWLPFVRALRALHERPAQLVRGGRPGAPRGHAPRRDDEALARRPACPPLLVPLDLRRAHRRPRSELRPDPRRRPVSGRRDRRMRRHDRGRRGAEPCARRGGQLGRGRWAPAAWASRRSSPRGSRAHPPSSRSIRRPHGARWRSSSAPPTRSIRKMQPMRSVT